MPDKREGEIDWRGNCPHCGVSDCTHVGHLRRIAEYFHAVSEDQMDRAERAESALLRVQRQLRQKEAARSEVFKSWRESEAYIKDLDSQLARVREAIEEARGILDDPTQLREERIERACDVLDGFAGPLQSGAEGEAPKHQPANPEVIKPERGLE